jgi:hypothetical protein
MSGTLMDWAASALVVRSVQNSIWLHDCSELIWLPARRLLNLVFGILRIVGTVMEWNRTRSHDCSELQAAPLITVLEHLEHCSGMIWNGVHTVFWNSVEFIIYACNHALLYSLVIRIIKHIMIRCYLYIKVCFCNVLLVDFAQPWRPNSI